MTHETQEQCDAEHRFDDEPVLDSEEVANLRANHGEFKRVLETINNNDDVEAFEGTVNQIRGDIERLIKRYDKAIERLER